MEVTPKQIIFYRTPDEKTPFETWYDEICDLKLLKAVDNRLARVRNGNYGDCESVGDGVLELRFHAFGVRVYFAEIAGIIVLLLCAGDKASQAKDIAKAKEYWNEFCTRAGEV